MSYLCLFASSSTRLRADHYRDALTFGRGAAAAGWDLVFGGANVGLMDAAARGFRAGGARIVSVIPHHFDAKGLTWTDAEEILLTQDLRERKGAMDSRARAFVALPGGPGTADEWIEVLTLKQIGLHDRPILLLNSGGHWDGLLAQLALMWEEGFCREDPRSLAHVAGNVEELLELLGPAPGGPRSAPKHGSEVRS